MSLRRRAVSLLVLSSALAPLLALPAGAQVKDASDPGARRPVPPAPVHSLLTVDLAAAGLDLLDLRRAGFDVAHVRPGGVAEVIASPDDLGRLAAREIPHEILHRDLSAFYLSRLVNDFTHAEPEPISVELDLDPPFAQGSMGGYYTYAEVVSILGQIHAARPDIVSAPFSIGQSLEGREIWAVKLSDNPGVDEAEPEVRFDSLHHAREPQGMQTALWTLIHLVEGYGQDALATWIVDNREIWFLPVVNPDGYVYNETTNPGGGGLWRKNRRPNGGGGGGSFGVDLNRNYTFQWGFDDVGSSPVTSDPDYRGPSAASEPETQVMIAFISSRSFETALSIHTYSNLWLAPFGYTASPPGNVAEYDELNALATAINMYLAGPAALILYPANGVTFDYDHGVHGTHSWTPEIGSSSDGFWPPTERIVPLAEENRLALLRTARAAGAYVHASSVSLVDAGDGDGFFEPGETVEVSVTARNSGRAGTAGSVEARLLTASPDATVGAGSVALGAIASFASASNPASSLTLSIDGGATEGAVLAFTVELEAEGLTDSFAGTLIVGEPTISLADDCEADAGWTTGIPSDTATSGIWERGDPVGTSNLGLELNPEDDATPAPGVACYATGNGSTSPGGDDVDNGDTTLLSPAFDLSGVTTAFVSYSRWYADETTPDDAFEISISDDGGSSWTPLESVTGTQNTWTRVTFRVNDFVPLTSTMQLRFRAEDDPNNSLVEAGIDDLEIVGYGSMPLRGPKPGHPRAARAR